MQQREPLIVPNTEKEPRFSYNPLVTGGPNIRFYCGMLLRSEGLGLGSLCVIDRTPRTLTPEQTQSPKSSLAPSCAASNSAALST